MLRILEIKCNQRVSSDDTGDNLFKRNPEFNLIIEAPMYWWLDCEFERFDFIFPKNKNGLSFCDEGGKIFPEWVNSLRTLFTINKNISDREVMQILPLGTIISGRINLSYQKIIEICENYQCGEYSYQGLRNQWPTEREWKDFCETLLDLRGVRDLVEV